MLKKMRGRAEKTGTALGTHTSIFLYISRTFHFKGKHEAKKMTLFAWLLSLQGLCSQPLYLH